MSTAGALAGITIVEIATRVSGEYAVKLLADLGATAIKVEPPEGDPTRRLGPFRADDIGCESALFHYLNANKKSVVVDLADDAGRARLDGLLARAHALIDDHDETWAEAHGLTQGAIVAAHPHLAHCIVTPFGQGAPPDWQRARPINVINAGGWAYHTPSEMPPDKPPLKGAGRFLSDYEAGIDAALCVLASLHRQRRMGQGQFIDISEVEVQLNRVDGVLGRMLAGEAEPGRERTAYDMGGPGTSFACRDGHVYLFMTTKAHWLALCKLMGEPDWARNFREDWLEFDCTKDRVAAFRGHFAGWIADRDKRPVTEAAQRLGVAMVPVNTAADLPANEQLAHRGFFQEFDHPRFGRVVFPTACYRLSATPVRIASAAPGLGADQRDLDNPPRHGDGDRDAAGGVVEGAIGLAQPLDGAPARKPPPPPFGWSPSPFRGGFDRGGPLAGVRVLALTKVWAGPYAGKLLAHLGAEVIKVESRTNLDEMRAYGGVDIDCAPYFLSINQEILSVRLNMKSEEGLDLLRRMVAKSDIVIDNIRPGAMERSRLSFEDLRKIKPDIIQCSIKMWGSDGPLGYQTGYAPCFAALSGLTALVGHEGETPKGMNIRYGDSTAGAYAALACVAALHHRTSTGEGQFIDLSAVEAMTTLVGDSLFAHAVTGELPRADGNFHPEMCPHGAYPCRDGEWISIAVADEGEWRALCGVLGADALAIDPRFASLAARLAERHVLDAMIGALAAAWAAADLADRLRGAGVPAFKSMSSLDLCSDQYLWGGEAYRMVSDHSRGSRPIIGPSWRMAPDMARIERGAPLLGEHNEYVYRDILGLPPEQLEDLIARKIVD